MRERRPERGKAIVGDSERARGSENDWGREGYMGEVYRSESKVLDLLRVREKIDKHFAFFPSLRDRKIQDLVNHTFLFVWVYFRASIDFHEIAHTNCLCTMDML